MTIAVCSVWFGEKFWRRLRGSTAEPAAIDYRFAAFGSQIPDLIDKPLAKLGIGGFTYAETSGHTVGHTLLVAASIILIGMIFARRGDLRLLVLGVGCLTHPLVDPTNTYPQTLFWPLFGTDFPHSHQAYRSYFQIPLDILLATTYALISWRSQRWRGAAIRFIRTGAFPVPHREISGKRT